MIRIQNALNARRAALREGDRGFTLIELLVVVIIIGILAAIAIPIYIGVQNNAKDSAVKTDIANAKIAVVAYYTETSKYPTDLTVDLTKYGYKAPASTDPNYTNIPTINYDAAKAKFCIAATASTTTAIGTSDSSGIANGTCAAGVFTKTP